MKLIIAGLGLAALTAAPLAAQQSEVKSKTKIEVQKGDKIKAVGCVAQASDGYELTNVSGEAARSYLLVGKTDDLAKHVGHRVEISGKAADSRDGKVVTETKTKVDDGKEQKTKVKSEGDLGMAVIGVDSVKVVPGSCDR